MLDTVTFTTQRLNVDDVVRTAARNRNHVVCTEFDIRFYSPTTQAMKLVANLEVCPLLGSKLTTCPGEASTPSMLSRQSVFVTGVFVNLKMGGFSFTRLSRLLGPLSPRPVNTQVLDNVLAVRFVIKLRAFQPLLAAQVVQ
jgi:hypothetical protein